MTLRQEAYAMIDSLPEKRQAFLHMEEMKKKYPFPKDYDYEQVRREVMDEFVVSLK